MTERRRDARPVLAAMAAVAALLLVGALIYLKKPRAVDVGAGSVTRDHADQRRIAEIRTEFNRGVELLYSRQFEAAAGAFHRVLVLAPTLPEGHLNMAFALFEMGDLAGARKFFQGAKALAPRLAAADYGLALVANAEGRHELAARMMEGYLGGLPAGDPNREKAIRRLSEIRAAAATAGGRR